MANGALFKQAGETILNIGDKVDDIVESVTGEGAAKAVAEAEAARAEQSRIDAERAVAEAEAAEAARNTSAQQVIIGVGATVALVGLVGFFASRR